MTNSFGNIYRLTSFGESHGAAVGGVIDGLPAGRIVSLENIRKALARRAPGGSPMVSSRREPERLHILSGLMALDVDAAESALLPREQLQEHLCPLAEDSDVAVTLGTPVGFYVENADTRPGAYDNLRNLYRPNHADFTYAVKYGVRDWRGGGRSSGRETVSRVVGGAFACELLTKRGVEVDVALTQVGNAIDPRQFAAEIERARAEGDSLGGIVSVRISQLPAGIGEPTFGKLQQQLASAMLSIGGVHGFEYGDGFTLGAMRGSEAADCMSPEGFLSNHCGGILGGISTGQDISFRVVFKPTPSIARHLPTINTRGEHANVLTTGRHDPCIALRGAEVVRAMTWMVLLDMWMIDTAHHLM